jgi:hypothetical protein
MALLSCCFETLVYQSLQAGIKVEDVASLVAKLKADGLIQ